MRKYLTLFVTFFIISISVHCFAKDYFVTPKQGIQKAFEKRIYMSSQDFKRGSGSCESYYNLCVNFKWFANDSVPAHVKGRICCPAGKKCGPLKESRSMYMKCSVSDTYESGKKARVSCRVYQRVKVDKKWKWKYLGSSRATLTTEDYSC